MALHLAEVALNEQVSCLPFLYPGPGCPACPCCPVKGRLRQHANKKMAELALNEQVSSTSFLSEPGCLPAHADGLLRLAHTSTNSAPGVPTPIGAQKANLSREVIADLAGEVLNKQAQSPGLELL